MVKKVEPILGRLKPQLTQEELCKVATLLIELPYNLEETKQIEKRNLLVEEFVDKFQDLNSVGNPDHLVTEYRRLDTRIPSFEVIIKKMENDRGLIGAVISEANAKLEWPRGIKLLQRLKSVSMMDQKQAQALVINNMLHQLTQRFLQYLKKRNLCNPQESDEVVLETCSLVQKSKRLDFLKKEKISGEELASVVKVIEAVLDEQSILVWNPEDWMRDKEFEINDLGYNQRFLRNLCKDLDLSLEHDQVLTELPHGAYLEDFMKGYSVGRPSLEGTSTDYLKGVSQELQKNLEKNSTFELTKFAAYLEAERIFSEVMELQSCPRKFENQIQRLNHFLWKIRIYKHEYISAVIKNYMFEPKVIQRLANRSDSTLKKLELKLKGGRKLKRLYLRGNRFFNKPDKIVSKESKLKAAEERDLAERKKNGLRDVHDDWKGLHAHFKMALDPGLEKSKDFEIIFTHLRCKELCKPPMYIVFSKELSTKEFSDRVYQAAQSRSKELEIGSFSASKTRYLKKCMVRKNIVLQANLDGCNLYLFTKEQWPSQRLLSVSGQSHLDQQLRLNFVPTRDRSTGHGDFDEIHFANELKFTQEGKPRVTGSNSQHYLKKRDSSSIFDLEEGQEGWEEIVWDEASDNNASQELNTKGARKKEKSTKPHVMSKDRRKLYIEEDEQSDKPKQDDHPPLKEGSRVDHEAPRYKKLQDQYYLRDKSDKTDTLQRSQGLKSTKNGSEFTGYSTADKLGSGYPNYQDDHLDNWEIPKKKLYRGPKESETSFSKPYEGEMTQQDDFFAKQLSENTDRLDGPPMPSAHGQLRFFMQESSQVASNRMEKPEFSLRKKESHGQAPHVDEGNEEYSSNRRFDMEQEDGNSIIQDEEALPGVASKIDEREPAAEPRSASSAEKDSKFSRLAATRIRPSDFINSHVPSAFVAQGHPPAKDPQQLHFQSTKANRSAAPVDPVSRTRNSEPPKELSVAKKQKSPEQPHVPQDLHIQIEEISEDVGSQQSDFEDLVHRFVPPEEEINFDNLFRDFDLLNPDFRYDTGNADADADPQQMMNDHLFSGGLDLSMAQDMRGGFLGSHPGYVNMHTAGYPNSDMMGYSMVGGRGISA